MMALSTTPSYLSKMCGLNKIPGRPSSIFLIGSFLLIVAASTVPEVVAQQQINTNQQASGNSSNEDFSLQEMRSYENDLKSYLISKGGYWNDKVAIRRRVPGDSSSPTGVFAVQDLQYDELVFHIPQDAYFKLPQEEVYSQDYYETLEDFDDLEDDEEDDYDEEDIEEQYDLDWRTLDSESTAFRHNNCRLSKRLLEEINRYQKSSDSSEYVPFIRYLQDTHPRGQLPAAYSLEGKALLRKIQGIDFEKDFYSPAYGKSPLPPAGLVDWIDDNFISSGICPEAKDDDDLYHAIALSIQRGYDLELIPVWDMVNHDVYERVNLDTTSLRSKRGLKVYTTRPIAAGEELLYTYNFCTDCFDVGIHWGTAGIYRDFGFLEGYPQEWAFLDRDVYAQIRRRNETDTHDGTDDYYAIFHQGDGEDRVYTPDQDAIIFFQEQLSRLQGIDVPSEVKFLESSYERSMIQQYYDALVIALDRIIHAGLLHLKNHGSSHAEL